MGLDIRLLGEFRVRDGDRDIPAGAWDNRRAAELVKLLALSPDQRLVKELVLDALWPQLDPDAGSAALHKAASIARKVLGLERVVLRLGEVALAPNETVTTDVLVFEAAARKAIADADPKACARAATLYGGELLPADRYADWSTRHRDRLAARHVELLRRAGAWDLLVEHDPLDERGHLALMRVYADAGNRAAALRQFQRMKQSLAQAGMAPSVEATRLHDALSHGPAVHAPVAAGAGLLGREVELARARSSVRKVAEGRGHTLLVRGDAGMGKTSFCERVLSEAAAAGASTLRGAARFEGPGAYAPVVEALEPLLVERPDLAIGLTDGARQVLARLATNVPFVPGDEERAIQRQRVLSAVTQLLTLAAKERPVVLFVDDLHEADDSTLELVHYVAQHARAHRVLLLVAARPVTSASFARIRATLAGQRTLTEVDLAPLARDEVAALIERVTAARPSEATVAAVVARAAGNPLYAELLAGTGAPEHDLPADLNAVLEGALLRAGEPTVAVLRRLAVLGTRFTMPELLGVAGDTEASCFDHLDRALRARVVEEVPGAYRFHHALFVDSLLRGLPSHRLREAHRDAARVLAGTGAPASRIARQLVAAEAGADAVPWLAQAAQEEAQVAAYASALQFLELALAQAPGDPQLLLMRAGLRFATGSPDTPAAYEAAIAAAPEAGRATLRPYLARAHLALDVMGAARSLAAAELPDDPAARVVFWIVSGQVAWFTGDLDTAERTTRAACELAEATGDEAGLVEATLARGIVAHSRGGYAEHLASDLLADRAPALAGIIHEGHLCISTGYLESGLPFPPMAAFARELRAAGERTGARRAVAFADLVTGEAALLAGALDEAAEPLRRATEVNLEVGSRSAAAMAMVRRAELALADDRRAEVEPLLADALELARTSPQGQRHLLQRIFGLRMRSAADPARAVAWLDQSEVAIVGPGEGCMGCSIALLIPAVIACAGAGQLERAAGYLHGAEQVGAALWPQGPWQAALEEARAALAAGHGDGVRARGHLQRARAIYLEVGQNGHAAACARALDALPAGA